MQNGQFNWYDVMTTDTKAAQAFYAAVVGWKMRDFAGGHGTYTVLELDNEIGVGGIMDLPQAARDMGSPPFWIGYITVDDVDAYTAKVKAAGGGVSREPNDIPDVGRFSVVSDPQGAHFMLFRPNPRPAPPPPAPGTLGTFGWRELMTTDLDAAFAFYSDIFGWTKGDAHEMGEHGVYQLFQAGPGEPYGGMMKKPDFIQAPPFWSFYINVDSAKAAAERLTAAGGKILNGPMQVPTGRWIVQGMDPQGAAFCLLSEAE